MLNTLNNKIVAGGIAVALAGGGAVAVDTSIVTDKELFKSMNQALVEGKIPQIDLEKVDLDRVASAYAQIAIENGVDLTPTVEQVDLYDKIREAKAKKGEELSPKTNDVLKVR